MATSVSLSVRPKCLVKLKNETLAHAVMQGIDMVGQFLFFFHFRPFADVASALAPPLLHRLLRIWLPHTHTRPLVTERVSSDWVSSEP